MFLLSLSFPWSYIGNLVDMKLMIGVDGVHIRDLFSQYEKALCLLSVNHIVIIKNKKFSRIICIPLNCLCNSLNL